MRVKVTLRCNECKQRNYNTMKNKKNTPDKLELNKYCPFCKKHTRSEENIIVMGLNFDIQDTMIAVNPFPPTALALMEWSVPAARIQPITPQSAPEIRTVRMMTFFTLIPIYLAVFSLSPTTAISYPCLLFLR